MDLAQVLVRSVARAFYSVEQAVIVDALVIHSALSLNDLAYVLDLGKQFKTVQKLIGGLKIGGLISVYVRQEHREGALKPLNREYFYIDYRRAVDATKHRIHTLDTQIKAHARPSTEKKDFTCPRCKSQYTQMDVLDSPDLLGRGSGFICKRCGNLLDYIGREDGDEQAGADDEVAMFNKQFAPLLKLLQQIDDAIIPAVTGQAALEAARPVPRDETTDPGAQKISDMPEANRMVRPTAVKGIATGPEKIEISITSAAEGDAKELAAEAERKARLAKQNTLPEWHTRSTVTGEATPAGLKQDYARKEMGGARTPLRSVDEEEEEEKKDARDADLDNYFAALEEERKKAQAEAEDDEDDEDEDEDEDDEFEDVLPAGIAGTPTANGAGGLAVKRESPDASAEEERAGKRVKLEPEGSKSSSSAGTPLAAASGSAASVLPTSGNADGDGDDSDADDFEDVL